MYIHFYKKPQNLVLCEILAVFIFSVKGYSCTRLGNEASAVLRTENMAEGAN